MKLLEDLVSIASSSYTDSLDEIQKSMKTNITSVEDIVSNAQNNVDSLSELMKGYKNKFSAIFMKDRIVLEHSLTLKDSAAQHDSSLVQAFAHMLSSAEKTQKAIYGDIEKLNQIVAQQRQEMEELVLKQSTHLKKVSKITNSSFESIKKGLKAFIDSKSNDKFFKL